MEFVNTDNQAMSINAAGGVLIGLLLGAVLIFGGFSMILGTDVEFDDRSYPAWVDQRYATNSAYQAVPSTHGSELPIVVAEARH